MRLKGRKRRGKRGALGNGKSKGRGSGRGDADGAAMVISTGFDGDFDIPALSGRERNCVHAAALVRVRRCPGRLRGLWLPRGPFFKFFKALGPRS
jgi:hypothetical protein